MSRKSFKEVAKWTSLVWAAIALGLVLYVRTKFIFDSGNTAGMLVLVAMVAAVFTLIFGVAALPRWQGFLALAAFVAVAYFIFFTRLYGVV